MGVNKSFSTEWTRYKQAILALANSVGLQELLAEIADDYTLLANVISAHSLPVLYVYVCVCSNRYHCLSLVQFSSCLSHKESSTMNQMVPLFFHTDKIYKF